MRDKTTGFVLGDNSPESITDSVLKALAFPHTDRIVDSAWAMVRKEFTLEAAVQGFQSILQEMYPDEAVDISDANSAPEGQ